MQVDEVCSPEVKISQHKVAFFDGQEIIKYSLRVENKLQIDVLNYGGVICGVWVPDKAGVFANVILAYEDFADYINNVGYLGAIIGRHAGRIGNGEFAINGIKYQLEINCEPNNLHGGKRGLDKRIWQVEVLNNGIRLYYFSPHLEEGFTGNVHFTVSYQIIAENTLRITSYALPDQEALINLTNHSTFNLSGCACLATTHQLQINASDFCLVDNNSLITGDIAPVCNTVFDFRSLKSIDSGLANYHPQLALVGGYDHPFILEKNADFAAKLLDLSSGRSLTIMTTEPALVFYSGNLLIAGGKVNKHYYAKRHLGVCLEAQNVPNAINMPNWPNNGLYTPDNPYFSTTEWQF